MNGRLLILSLGAAVTLACDRGSPTASRLPSLHADAVGAVVVSAITDLGTLPGGDFSSAAAINAAGVIVGSSNTQPGGPSHAALWQPDGTVRDLGTLPGGEQSFAVAINARVQVAGSSSVGGFFPFHAFRWENGVMTDLGTLPGGGFSSATGINNAGDVVGSSGGHPVLWRSDGSLVDLGTLPGSVGGGATAINDHGQVVGSSNFPDFVTVHAFLWQAGTMIDLGTLGGDSSIALAINNAGQVVGTSTLPGPFAPGHAFLWQQGAGMTDLGTLPGGSISGAAGISASGRIVGRGTTATGQEAFFWQAGTFTGLGTLGGPFSSAMGVNASGQVVGFSATPSFAFHAVRWTMRSR